MFFPGQPVAQVSCAFVYEAAAVAVVAGFHLHHHQNSTAVVCYWTYGTGQDLKI